MIFVAAKIISSMRGDVVVLISECTSNTITNLSCPEDRASRPMLRCPLESSCSLSKLELAGDLSDSPSLECLYVETHLVYVIVATTNLIFNRFINI